MDNPFDPPEEIPNEQQDVSGAPLTREERKQLRQMLKDDDRARWLWATVRIWGAYIGGILIGIYTLEDPIMRFFKWIFR